MFALAKRSPVAVEASRTFGGYNRAMATLLQQFKEALEILRVCRTPPALIGGLALVAHQVVRATQDVDFLVDADDGERVHEALLSHGYRNIHRSADAANYARGAERLDLLMAHRPRARQLLEQAALAETGAGPVRVVSVEGLIGLKLQGFVNDPQRTQDLEDIRALLRRHRDHVDLGELRDYFALFEREQLLDELLDHAG